MKALHRIFGVLTCFPVVLSLLLLPLLPERIPAHYNLYGQVDRWGSRLEVLLLPLCCLVGGLIWKRLIQKMSLTQPQNQKPILVAGCSLLAALDALSCVILFFSFSAAPAICSSPACAFTHSIPPIISREAKSNPAITSSFTPFALAPGVLKTTIPFSAQVFRGILLTPAPALATAFTLSGNTVSCKDALRTSRTSASSIDCVL